TYLQPGSPIRKSSDQCLVIDSPRLIADSYVLLRFLVPRHTPCALKNLSHKDASVHCVVLNIQTTHPSSRTHQTHPQPRGSGMGTTRGRTNQKNQTPPPPAPTSA